MTGGKDIEKLIPHRAPFLFVDEVTAASPKEITAIKTFDRTEVNLQGSFQDFGFVPGTILIESMAQAGGAGVRLLEITNGIFALVQIEHAQFFAGVPFGEMITYTITNHRLSEKIIKQSGKAHVNGSLVMEASWMSIKIDERRDS
jgi:3-hydroxyacyl-[acyl-carrier-protein] dehydratase